MSTVYKWTDDYDRTLLGMQWGKGVVHIARGGDHPIGCSAWIHAFNDPRTAVLLDYSGRNYFTTFEGAGLWVCDAVVGTTKNKLELGCTWLRTRRKIVPPKISLRQMMQLASLCSVKALPTNTYGHQLDAILRSDGVTLDLGVSDIIDSRHPTAAFINSCIKRFNGFRKFKGDDNIEFFASHTTGKLAEWYPNMGFRNILNAVIPRGKVRYRDED